MQGSAAAFKQPAAGTCSLKHARNVCHVHIGRHCCRMPSEEEEGAISSSRHCASASPNIEVSQRGEREIREVAIIDALRNRRCPYPWSRRAEEHILSCLVVSCHHVLVSAEDRMMHKAEQVMQTCTCMWSSKADKAGQFLEPLPTTERFPGCRINVISGAPVSQNASSMGGISNCGQCYY